MGLFKKDNQEESQANLNAVVQGNIRFAMDLFQRLGESDGNLFFSPYSICMALAMTSAGARGDTYAQMMQAMDFPLGQFQLHPSLSKLAVLMKQAGKMGHVQLVLANTLFPRLGDKFLKEFLTLVKRYYGVKLMPIDFTDEPTARRIINAWVEDRTQSRIKDLIGPDVLDGLTRLVLVNAIYFKGAWANKFDPALTSLSPFWTAADSQVQVPMMTCQHPFKVYEEAELQVLELPYAGDALSMLVFLPREKDGLAKLEKALNEENLKKWSGNLVESDLHVSLPRFELAFPFRLDDTLKSMGMRDAFSDHADFSGMDSSHEIFLGAVLHKAFIEVNEQGTEAAAATAVVMQTKSVSFPSHIFLADHPFVFLIRENNTGSILFIGRVANPV